MLAQWERRFPADRELVAVLSDRSLVAGLVGGTLLLVGLGMRLAAQVAAFVEPGETASLELAGIILEASTWGRGWEWQLGAAVITSAGFLTALRYRVWGWVVAGVGGTLMAVVAPFTGHAMSEAAGSGGIVFDAARLLGGGAWIGTLALVAWSGFPVLRKLEPPTRETMVIRLITGFSPVAIVGASLATIAGSVMSWHYLGGSLSNLVTTGYGRALSLKLSVVAVVALIGAYNWRILTPKLGTPEGSTRIQTSARRELLVTILLLALTAVLVGLPMPAEAQ